ncbi:hypothetical protein [Rhodopseudomonas sp. BR0G17]|uniref:hypothetical protein n=1 Tax=Rhodopseudomonas sp. BR0G17 TaxID=2269368 RepID=UPI0013DFC684|nr:hypothetical protein [Rhodopseudomonas sp. BR0G17]
MIIGDPSRAVSRFASPAARANASGVGLPQDDANAPQNTNLADVPIELHGGAALLMALNRATDRESRCSYKTGDDA